MQVERSKAAQRRTRARDGQLAAIGGTIRTLSRRRRLSLRDLSRLTGLSGELVFVVGAVAYGLGAGDSIHFQASVRHAVRNDSSAPADVLVVLSSRLF